MHKWRVRSRDQTAICYWTRGKKERKPKPKPRPHCQGIIYRTLFIEWLRFLVLVTWLVKMTAKLWWFYYSGVSAMLRPIHLKVRDVFILYSTFDSNEKMSRFWFIWLWKILSELVASRLGGWIVTSTCIWCAVPLTKTITILFCLELCQN